MNSSLLRDKITILRKTISRDDYGSEVVGYSPYQCCFAYVEYESSDRTLDNSEIYYNNRVNFHIRYYHHKDIQDHDRICFDCKHWHILRINKHRQQNKVILVCEEVKD